MQSIPSIMMNSGSTIPALGLGVYKIEDSDMDAAVSCACECGYRLFDTASVYKNEAALGRAIRNAGVPRSELFITSKVWNTAQRMGDVRGAFERSLERLGLDYIDLYLLHYPVPGCTAASWEELAAIRDAGLAVSIGVSNFEITHLEQLYRRTGILPAVNQIECHPLWNRDPLIRWCREKGITVQAFAPLARGMYARRELLVRTGERYGKSAVQTGLRYLVQKGVSVIPKSVQPERIRSNAAIFDFSLSDAEMTSIDALDEQFQSARYAQDLDGTDWMRVI